MTKENIRFSIPEHHQWLKGLRGGSLVLEYLLDKEFGTAVEATGKPPELVAAEKIVKAQEIIKEMREKTIAAKQDERGGSHGKNKESGSAGSSSKKQRKR